MAKKIIRKKKKHLRLKRGARRTIAALLMVTALIVAAIPAPSVKASDIQSENSLNGGTDATDTENSTDPTESEMEIQSTSDADDYIDASDGIRYYFKTGTDTYGSDGTIAMFVGYDDNPDDSTFNDVSQITTLNIPSTFNSYDVEQINDFDDGNNSNLTLIYLPSTVKYLNSNAFDGCTNVETINIPDSDKIVAIGDSAFAGTENLSTSITIGANVTNLGTSVFNDSSVTTVTVTSTKLDAMPAGVFTDSSVQKVYMADSSIKNLDSSCFEDCTNINEVTLPSALQTIGDSAFSGCTGITDITIPSTLISLGASAFKGCTALKSVTDFEGCGVTNLYSNAFNGCSSLTSMTTPTSPDYVTIADSSVFAGCTGLQTVDLAENVNAIPDSAFANCTALQKLYVRYRGCSVGSSITPLSSGKSTIEGFYIYGYASSDEGEVVTDSNKTEIFAYAEDSNILFKDLEDSNPDSSLYGDYIKVNSSGIIEYVSSELASSGYSDLWNGGAFIVPESITVVKDGGTSERTITGIGAYALAPLEGDLSTVYINNTSFTTLEDNAFKGLSNLELLSVVTDDGITSIGSNVFDGCSADLVIYGTQKSDNTLFNYAMDNSFTLGGTAGSYIPVYNKNHGDVGYLLKVEHGDSYNTLTDYKTEGTTDTVELPSGIEYIGTDSGIGEKIFKGNEDLTSFTANGLLVIDSLEFQGDTGLTSVTLAASPTSIGTTPWRDCTSLPYVEISTEGTYSSDTTNGMIFEGSSSSPTSIVEALEGNSAGKYAVPSTVTSIYPYAFYNRQNLQTLDLTAANGLTKIQNNTFEGMKALKKVSIGQNMKTVATEAFKDVPDGTMFYVYSSSISYSDDYDCFDPANGDNSSDYYFYGTSEDNSDNTYYMCNTSTTDGLNWGGTTDDSAKTSLSSDNIASSPTKITKTIDDDTTEISIEKGTDFNLILTSGSTTTTISTDEYYVSGTWYDSTKTAMEAAPDSEGSYYIMVIANTDSELYEGYRYIPVAVTDSSSTKTDISSKASWKPKGLTMSLDDIKANSGLIPGDDADALENGADFYLYLTDDDTAISTADYYLGYYYTYTFDSSTGSYTYTAIEDDYPTVSGNFAVACIAKSTSSDYTGTLYVRFTVTDGSSSDDDDSSKTSLDGNVYADPEPIEISLYDRSPATVTKGIDFNLYRVSDNALVKTDYYSIAAYCDSSYNTLSSAPTSEGTYYVKLTATSSTVNPWKGSIYVQLDVYEEDPNKTSLSADCYAKPSIIKKAIPSSGKTVTVVKGTDFNIYRVSDNSLIDTSYYEITGYLDSSKTALSGVPYEAGSYYVVVQPYSSDSEVTGTLLINMTVSVGGTLSINAIEDQYWTGSAVTPDIKVTSTTDSDLTLTKGIDYTSAYSSNINAGAATVTATGISDYNGDSATATFSILKSIANCTINATNTEYTGKATTPTVTITDGSKKLTLGTDFVISAIDKNVKVNNNKGVVTVEGIGYYYGEATANFSVRKTYSTSSSSSSSSKSSSKSSSSSSSSSSGSSGSTAATVSSSTANVDSTTNGSAGNGNGYVNTGKTAPVDPGDTGLDDASATINGSTDNYVVKIRKSSTADSEFRQALTDEYGNIDAFRYYAFDISLYDETGTEKIEDPQGVSVTLTIPLPDSLALYGGNNQAAAVSQSGDLENLSTRFTSIDGKDCASFTATHFSTYGFYVDTNNLSAGNSLDSTPKTGDPISPKWFLSLGLAALSVFLFLKKDPLPARAKVRVAR
ncbi:leucine-rich repeat protein [Lachnospiraceae bacterium C1.1]|nr:leucine-rich repeat protein [Lachnospiraceae bacterium C1.1]